MNKSRLEAIAKWLDSQRRKRGIDGLVAFDMTTFRDKDARGTRACIAGAAVEFFSGLKRMPPYELIQKKASHLLDLDDEQAEELFVPIDVHDSCSCHAVTEDPQWAARVIRNLIATGEVDWQGTRKATPTPPLGG